MNRLALTLGMAFVVSLVASPSFGGISAQYVVWGAQEKDKPAVSKIVISTFEVRDKDEQEWQLEATLAAGGSFALRAVTERVPMSSAQGPGRFSSYLFRDSRGKVTRYRHALTGKAVLPAFDFLTGFLPTCRAETVRKDGFAISGRYLGHIATLQTTQQGEAPPAWRVDFDLELNPDMLVGILWSTKDDGTGLHEDKDYRYVELTEADYQEMIAAGCNYFGPPPKHRPFVQDAPVFFRMAPEFPEDFYRSNYAGIEMLTDEPAVRLGLPNALPPGITHPTQIADLLETRVRALYGRDGARYSLHNAVKAKASLGTLDLAVNNIPCWETLYETAFYEMEGGAGGIVHEGRYQMDTFGWHPQAMFSSAVEVKPEEMLRWHYAVMRGAARAFDRSWGTSLYGQCDSALRWPALKVAYDMGARWFWFWSADHDHHLVHQEKLRLMRLLKDYARSHPRPVPQVGVRAASTAIALPWGYALCFNRMFNQGCLDLDARNELGVPYREAVAAAAWEGVLCAMRGEDFDFTIEHEGIERLGYRTIWHVAKDGSVRVWPADAAMKADAAARASPLKMELQVDKSASATQPVSASPATSAPTQAVVIKAVDRAAPMCGMMRWQLRFAAANKARGPLRLETNLQSLSPLPPATTAATATITPDSAGGSNDVLIRVQAAPGRYRLRLAIRDAQGTIVGEETQAVFIFPPRPGTADPPNQGCVKAATRPAT